MLISIVSKEYVKDGLQSEVSRVNELYIGFGIVALERLCTRRDEDRIILAPDNERWGLPLAEVGLELGVQVNIGAIVVEEIKLDLVVAGTVNSVVV